MSNPVIRGIQVNTDIMGNPGVTFRVLLEPFPAIVAAEIIFLVLIFAHKLCIVFINDGKADRIGCHNRFSPLYYAPLPAKSMSDLPGDMLSALPLALLIGIIAKDHHLHSFFHCSLLLQIISRLTFGKSE